ncbi:MAG: hypothetical protein ACKOW9_04775 [Candidatus Paceibacterota bacterium]
MNINTNNSKAVLNVITLILAITAFTLPLALESISSEMLYATRVLVAAGITTLLAIVFLKERNLYVNTIATLLAALTLDGAAAVTSNPNTPAAGFALALSLMVVALIIISLLKNTDHSNTIILLVLLSSAAWLLTFLQNYDLTTILLGAVALTAPALTIKSIHNPVTKNKLFALGAWLVATILSTKLITVVLAGYQTERVSREGIKNFTESNTLNIPELQSVFVTDLMVASSSFLLVGVLLIALGRSQKLRKIMLLLAIVSSGLTSTTISAATARTPEPIFSDILNKELRPSSAMLADQGAGPKERFRGYDFNECDITNNRDCFITYFDDIALQKGVVQAVRAVVDYTKKNLGETFPSHCHQTIHNLGQMSIDLTDGDFNKVTKIDPQVCGTGFTHGLWELQFNKVGPQYMFTRTGTICEELGMDNDWFRWTCHHILGHMMMTEYMEDPTTTMEYCLKVKELHLRNDCLAGGWMNFFQDDYIIEYFRSTGTPQELFNYCYSAKIGLVKMFCYQELFPVIYTLANGDDYTAGKMCQDYAEPQASTGLPWDSSAMDFADRCVQGLARAVAVSSRYDYRIVPFRCNSMPKSVRAPCLTSSAASTTLNTGSQKAGLEICKAIVDGPYRAYCVFWVKDSQRLLAQGPNASIDLPKDDETRLPGLIGGIPGSDAPRDENQKP